MSEAWDLVARIGCFAPFLVLIVGILGIQLYYRHKGAPARAAQLQRLRTDAIAQRLGLGIVEGDPSFVFHAMGSTSAAQRRVVLRGHASGLPLELVYAYQRTDRIGFSDVEVRTSFECRLSALAREPFPVFEVFPRGPVIPELAPLAPPASTGEPTVDAAYLVRTDEPRLAQLLGRHLAAAHPTFAATGVHLFGDGQRVSFVMHEKVRPHPAEVLLHAEQAARLVVELARAVGG